VDGLDVGGNGRTCQVASFAVEDEDTGPVQPLSKTYVNEN